MILRLLGMTRRVLQSSPACALWEVVEGCPQPWRPCSPFSLLCVAPGPLSGLCPTRLPLQWWLFEVQKLKDRETASRTALEAMTCKKSDRWQLKRCFCDMQRRLQAISCSLWRLADVLKPGVDFLGKWMGLFLVRRWIERRKCHAYQAF